MPQIPNTLQTISLDVGGSTSPANTLIPDALQRLGQTVAETTQGLLEQVQKSEAMAASSKALTEDSAASYSKLNELKTKYDTGYITDESGNKIQNPDHSFRTIGQEYEEWASERFRKGQENMPNGLAQDIYKQEARKTFYDSSARLKSAQMVMHVQAQDQDLLIQQRQISNDLRLSPDEERFYSERDRLISVISAQGQAQLKGQVQVKQDQMKFDQELVSSQMEGLLSQILSTPKGAATRQSSIIRAKKFLEGTDFESGRRRDMGLPVASDLFNPVQKTGYINELSRLSAQAVELDASDLNLKAKHAMESFEQMSLGNRPYQDIPVEPIAVGYRNLLLAGKKTEYEVGTAVGELLASKSVAGSLSSQGFILSSPEDKIKEMRAIEGVISQQVSQLVTPQMRDKFPGLEAYIKTSAASIFKKRYDQINDLMAKDVVKLAQSDADIKRATSILDFSNPKNLQDLASVQKERDDKMLALGGVMFGGDSPHFRLMQRSEAEQFASTVKSLDSYGDAAQMFKSLRAAGEATFAKKINTMIMDKDLPGEYRAAMFARSDVALSDTIKMIKQKDNIVKNGEEVLKRKGLNRSLFEAGVARKTSEYLSAMKRSFADSSIGEEAARAMSDLVFTKAMDIFAQEGGDKSMDKYAERAADAILKAQYTLVNGALIPNESYGHELSSTDQDIFRENMDLFKRPEMLKAFGVALPRGTEKPEEKFLSQIENEGRIDMNESGDGYYIRYYDKALGRWDQVLTRANNPKYPERHLPLVIPREAMLRENQYISKVGDQIQKRSKRRILIDERNRKSMLGR